ncbi:signal peptidase I [Acidipila sp. EB88]|uniref:signal peptidase I n=1 Tax=Acidipila sp. EB88 TaxID=2305226 RepID=UPI000F5D58CA|nr:signal peptidase I [Acidipila sp. EB88]RRA48594.1 signal peptidase I [Acidipila sp. EB88]
MSSPLPSGSAREQRAENLPGVDAPAEPPRFPAPVEAHLQQAPAAAPIAATHPGAHAEHFPLPSITDTLRSLLSMIVVALFLLTFVVQPFRIPSESMERTLLVGDFLLVNKQRFAPASPFNWLLPYRAPERGDVVVFRFPLDPEDYVVKRIIAMPGDRLHLQQGVVYLNEQPLREPYAVFESAYRDNYRDNFPTGTYTDPGVDTHWWISMRARLQNGDVVVPGDSYFVMGDNRNHSRDSRYWGFVPRSAILGRPFVIYFSLREPSATDMPSLPDDKLGNDPVNSVVGFARWDRMFRIVR